MIEKIFADTSGFVALGNEDDALHVQSTEIFRKLPPFRLITTNFIVSETVTRLLYDTYHTNAVAFGEMLFSSPLIEIVHVTINIENKAWVLFKKYSDKQFSFVDCTSFVLMKELNLQRSFGCDQHFEQMGFENLIQRQQ